MKRYAAYLGSRSTDHIVSHGLGDWYDIGPRTRGPAQLTSKGLSATATYYQDIEILRKSAELLHHDEDARAYSQLSHEVREAFNAKFFDAASGQYEKGSQTANAMPLAVGLVEPEKRQGVLEHLVESIRGNQNRVTAGDVGFSYVVKALTEAGRGDVMYDMMTQSEGPGYVMQLKKGATTLTEAWDAASGPSQNHLMLGHADSWLYRGLAGIQNAAEEHPGAIAWKEILIRPQIVEGVAADASGIRWVKGSIDSPRGRIESDWTLQRKKLTMHVTIPATATGTIYVPAADPAQVRVSGGRLAERRMEAGVAIFRADPGTYLFESTLP
jgi:hypothetical protein